MKIDKIHLVRILLIAVWSVALSCKGNPNTSGETGQKEDTHMNMEDTQMEEGEHTFAYVCPMHCEGSGSDSPGECPKCGMEYVRNEAVEQEAPVHQE